MNKKEKTIQSKRKIFRTWYNFSDTDPGYERSTGVSQTVPGQTMSIREILERFTSGQSLNIAKEGNYESEPDLDNINFLLAPDLDLTDYDEVKRQNQTTITRLSAEIDERKTKATVKRSASSEDDEGGRITEGKRNKAEESDPSITEQLRNTNITHTH